MEKQVATIMKSLAQLDACCREISDQRAAVEDRIQVTFKELREVLNVRETEVIGRLHQLTQGKLKGLAAHRDQIETSLAQLTSCLQFIRESLRSVNESDVLMMKTNTVKQVKELTTHFQPHPFKPNAKADMVFTVWADTKAFCQNHGHVFSPGLPDPSKCSATVKGAEVGKMSTALLEAINFEGKPCVEPIQPLESKLISQITGTTSSCSVESRGQSQYEICYQPTVKGRHELHIKVESEHVRGSPFSIAVKSPVLLGNPIISVSGVTRPWGVAVTQSGEVVVTEEERHCVSVFSQNGKKVRSFGTRGSGQGQFKNPRGVAVDGEGNIFVVDDGNHHIRKFTTEGQLLGMEWRRFSDPNSVLAVTRCMCLTLVASMS